MKKKVLVIIFTLLSLLTIWLYFCEKYYIVRWPEVKKETKPWSRWWWMGSAVDRENLEKLMKMYAEVGLGGLELTPIYGVHGYEEKFIPYLSNEWIEIFKFTLKLAKKYNLGLDMATGTGWPFGGPWVGEDDAARYIALKMYKARGGTTFLDTIKYIQSPLIRAIYKRLDIKDIKRPISMNENLQELSLEQVRFPVSLPIVSIVALFDTNYIDLTDSVDIDGVLKWKVPEGDWSIYALFLGWHGKMVERAAPGGEGFVIDHFNKNALYNYLSKFNEALKSVKKPYVRAFFNDSYEVDDAVGESNWTRNFLKEFKNRRGYKLEKCLNIFFGKDTTEEKERILCDYRETISDLLLDEFTLNWKMWAHSKKSIVRNQAHGSPANIIDLYANSDIPETEGNEIFRFKFASSASNITGKKLTSAEAATWLNEHFLTTLGDVKKCVDLFFLGGINHIFYHGTTYSPLEEEWPGWLFYASVNFSPSNPFWTHFNKLNEYVTRVQSFLQIGKPSSDVLVYYPIHDFWSKMSRGLLVHFSGEIKDYEGSDFYNVSESLYKNGYTFDYISDRLLQKAKESRGEIKTKGCNYKAIIVPYCKYINFNTFKKILSLANEGCTVIFNKSLPEKVSGFDNYKSKTIEFEKIKNEIEAELTDFAGYKMYNSGKGRVVISSVPADSVLRLLDYKSEALYKFGLSFIRKKIRGGFIYFIVNNEEKKVEDFIPIAYGGRSLVLFNPMSGRFGSLKKKHNGMDEVFLSLNPGESVIIRTYNRKVNVRDYKFFTKSKDDTIEIRGKWLLTPIEGNPVFPERLELEELKSWHLLPDTLWASFSGVAKYQIRFKKPAIKQKYLVLSLGKVKETARVFINDNEVATLITPPFEILIDSKMLKENNLLEIEVTNLMANGIAYLDRNGIIWKKFYNINFPPRRRENMGQDRLFTAKHWKPVESGLLGPVRIFPAEEIKP